uniref:Histone domain-containing protein n=1 Tax=Globodera pallida TaxID=36090 RepID=A0A183BR73_GLOPA
MCTTRKQRAGESIPIYAENISQLVDKAYPDGAGFNAQVRRELTVDLFRNAIQEAIEEDEAQNEIAREKLSSAQTRTSPEGGLLEIGENWEIGIKGTYQSGRENTNVAKEK